MTRRTSLKITDERERQLERASEIVADGPHDDPPMSDVLDAALAHLIQSEQNLQDARGEVDPETIQRFKPTCSRCTTARRSIPVGGSSSFTD